MSKQRDPLELDKCIVARLWYTAVTIVRDRGETAAAADPKKKAQRDVESLATLIGSCAAQGIDEHRWIAYNLLSRLGVSEETRRLLSREEFVSTLKLLDTQIPQRAEEELLKLFESVRAAKEKNDANSVCLLSEESLECLETSLLKNPALIHRIIDGLLCIWLPTRFAQTDSALQDVYFGSLKKLLLDGETAANADVASYRRTGSRLENERLAVLLSILSKINLTEAREDELLTWLFPALIRRCDNDDVELALYSRKDAKFFRAWHEFLDDTYARRDAADSLENATRISQIVFDFNDDDSTTSLNARQIFKRTLRRRTHWLTDIFDICLALLLNQRHAEVERILENPLLKDFWLLLLFKLLTDCPPDSAYSPETSRRSSAICTALKFLLRKLELSSYAEPSLLRLRTTLKNHADVLDWIVERKKFDDATAASCDPKFSVKKTLSLLQTRSVLSVLKATTNIHENSQDDVDSLLLDNYDSRSVFRAYRAMLGALEAILLCESYNCRYREVAERFDDTEKSLGGLFPLELRLEVIENIFSMLFLRHEDFADAADSGSEGGGDEDSADRRKNNSSKSTRLETGFLCNKYATRETLNRLRRSVNAVKFESAERKKETKETDDRLERRIDFISKAIADAFWRLELLTSADFVEKRETPDEENRASVTRIPQDSSILPDYRLGQSVAKNRTIFYRPNESSSDESEFARSDLDGSSEAGSQGNAASGGGSGGARRRKRLRRSSSTAAETPVASRDHPGSCERTLNCMLASNESLVLQCLWKSDYDRASQVIEMFGLKNSRLEGEILFSRAMKTFRTGMKTQSANTDAVDSPDVRTKQSTLENIRRAVSDGYHTSRSTGQVETFLAAQETCARLLSSDATTAKEILALASLDLSLTMSRTRQDSVNLSGVTMKYLQSCKKLLTGSRYHDFFASIHESLCENNSDLSISRILCDARIPLNVRKAREKLDYWSRLQEKMRIFRESQKETNNLDNSMDENALSPSERSFEEIMAICDNGEHYLPRLNAHLRVLSTIIPAEVHESTDGNFCLLKTSPDAYIGDQIFRLNLELEEVESVASRLGVNLVHSILVNCCPKLPFRTENPGKPSVKWGSTILNGGDDEDSSDPGSLEPNECATEILQQLLRTLTSSLHPRATLRPPDARRMRDKPEIRDILRRTRRLASLDLSNLSFGNHTLAFFINVWNLMLIHAMIDSWSSDPPTSDLRREIAFSSVGYEIGDLGMVSLEALRSKLVGQSAWTSRRFGRTEELNEPAWQDLDVPNDPRVVFAMANEFRDSPVVRIYSARTLNDDLNSSVNSYLSFYNKKADGDQSMSAPELINRYNEFIFRKANANHVDEVNIANTGSKVTYKPLVYAYEVRLGYEGKSLNPEILEAKKTPEFSWQRRIVKPSLLQYLEGHCWLLSYLVQRIHEESPTILDSNCDQTGRTSALENLVNSTWSDDLRSLNDDNRTVAGLREMSPTELWNNLENFLENGETARCLKIVNALPDSLTTSNVEIQRFKDSILSVLTTESPDASVAEILRYVYQIRDEQILARLILSRVNDLPVRACREILSHALSHRNKEKLPAHCKSRMNEISCRVAVFEKMLPYCATTTTTTTPRTDDGSCWHDVINHAERTNPVKIVRSLIDAGQFELCLEWLEYQARSTEIHWLLGQDLLVGLLNNGEQDQDFKHARKLLAALPAKKSLSLCAGLVGRLESIGALRFAVSYLLETSPPTEAERYRRAPVGIDILEQLEARERRSYAHLVERPLLMFEQMLMNCKLENLQRILARAREKGWRNEDAERFDGTVRFYAGKSLDFRVAVQGEPERVKDSSVSSNRSQNDDFVMPANIPTKDEWVPNDKARECSCCRVVIFTMFNRRHHCRRCGRVVCASCSAQRTRLPSYPSSVPVRVCDDCKRQMQLQLQAAQGAPSTPSSSEALDCWRLSVDETHNRTMRDEFSFENAPNISLCLAILNLHSDHEAYSNFLLDKCDDMKKLLRPDSEGRVNPEVDHALIIKMIRSLLLAAKVKCAELGLNTGLTHCDRFLSQVDLTMTLINSDCSSLIPRTDKDDYLGDHTLRRLRDLLMERERWIIALDVATKTGLDTTQGVWAAWGTTCLKTGYYERARDKFARCLDKVIREDSDDWVMLSYPGETTSDRRRRLGEQSSPDDSRRRGTGNSTSHEGLKSRPSRDPPLLAEILQILDRMNPNDWWTQQNPARTSSKSAREILATLDSLKSISQGQYASAQPNTAARNFRYQESLYYLLMYGSFNSILEFFVRHREYDKCLAYMLENDVEPELFMNVFLRCLRNGSTVDLCEAMRARDPSLATFRKYLMHTCHSLERKQLLNSLLQLQLFMKDYVRAAMTCIRFYVSDAASYEDLCSRTHFLADAQRHLESELQLENFAKKRRKSVSSAASAQHGLTLEMDPAEIDRHMNTISRQTEIAKFLGNREREGRSVSEFTSKLSYMDSEGTSARAVPTLFGNQQEKTHLAVLAILCGRDVEEGFGIAFRIMQDYNLRQQKIYSLVGHMLALDRNINSIEQLIKCCRSSGAPNSNEISDRVLAHCVKLLIDRSRNDSDPSPKDQIDSLIKMITDVELKIESYIESRQLKAAYLLAVKHSRVQDIRKILKEADRLGQLAIKSICTKWLRQTQGS